VIATTTVHPERVNPMKPIAGTSHYALPSWLRWPLLVLAALLGPFGCATGAPGDDSGGSTYGSSKDASTSSGSSSGADYDSSIVAVDTGSIVWQGDDGPANPLGDDGGGLPLDITPANPVLSVTIVDGTVTTSSVTFTASSSGTSYPAVWSLDRGDLGAIDSGGTFTASGSLPGVATVTASFGAHIGTTTVTVQISITNHGGTPASDPGPAGYGGVGGEGPGGPADPSLFAGTAKAPASAAEMSFLYPYDKTVWPRGLLAPLLQWTTTHTATAVYIHLSENDFDFKGYYAFAAGLTGPALMRQPIDQTAWDLATHGNQSDQLHVEVTIAATDGVIGPITENWIISPDILQGTVYYAAYNSALNSGAGAVSGAVLQIQPGVPNPSLAVPSLQGTCHVCHEVSANGSTLFTTYGAAGSGAQSGTDNGGSYDLTNGAALINAYAQGIFTYSGLYPDGTFGLANSNDNWWTYYGNSNIFSRSTLLAIPSTGFTNVVQQAVTPAFSPDGQHVAFNFRQGMSNVDAGAATGEGTLAVMDFSCGATAGSVTCGAPPYSFTNLRQIYNDPKRYAGWPSFSPDGNFTVFQSTIVPPTNANSGGSVLNTYYGATAELMIADARQPSQMPPQRLCALNGLEGDCATSYLPVVGTLQDGGLAHPNDTIYNYEPTVNPIASGGYYWVVFTARRAYGNVAQGDPYESNSYNPIDHPITKKLWVAAIDENPTSGVDPSHPAFYLPGQELNAGDMKGYWVVQPCRPDGSPCTTGDQCCDGFCRSPGDGGGLVCMKGVVGCANEFEKCITAADCCGVSAGYLCLNGYCSEPSGPGGVK